MERAPGIRERVIDTCSRLFYDQGYLTTHVNQVTAEAGISKSSFYQHFKSKEDLLLEYLTHAGKKWFDGLNELLVDCQSPAEILLTFFDYRKQLAETDQFKGCAFLRLVYELPTLDERAYEVIRRHKQLVKTLMFNQVQLLEPATYATARKELTELIYTLFEGCGVESSLQRSVKPIEESKAIVKRLIF